MRELRHAPAGSLSPPPSGRARLPAESSYRVASRNGFSLDTRSPNLGSRIKTKEEHNERASSDPTVLEPAGCREPARRLLDFLDDVLAYFTERLLLNPRLLWLWSAEGGNMRADFEPPTRAYYDAHVSSGTQVDELGPFPWSRG